MRILSQCLPILNNKLHNSKKIFRIYSKINYIIQRKVLEFYNNKKFYSHSKILLFSPNFDKVKQEVDFELKRLCLILLNQDARALWRVEFIG